jgi:hypothetical protein
MSRKLGVRLETPTKTLTSRQAELTSQATTTIVATTAIQKRRPSGQYNLQRHRVIWISQLLLTNAISSPQARAVLVNPPVVYLRQSYYTTLISHYTWLVLSPQLWLTPQALPAYNTHLNLLPLSRLGATTTPKTGNWQRAMSTNPTKPTALGLS